jgi:hypothetical protein
MTALFFILLTAFVAYIACVTKKYGVLASISLSFYRPKIGYLFTLWCMGVGVGVCALMAELSDGQWYQFLCLFAGAGLLFTGAAPHFKTYEQTIHYCAAGTCALSALVWMCAGGYWYIPIPLVAVSGGLALWLKRRKTVFWVELALFTSMFIVLGFKIL